MKKTPTKPKTPMTNDRTSRSDAMKKKYVEEEKKMVKRKGNGY